VTIWQADRKRFPCFSKFFGQPNGSKQPAQQTKLAFSKKPNGAAASETRAEEDTKPRSSRGEEDGDSKENVTPEKG